MVSKGIDTCRAGADVHLKKQTTSFALVSKRLSSTRIPINECLLFAGPAKDMESRHCKVVLASAVPMARVNGTMIRL